MNLNEKIKYFRNKSNFTQQELSNIAGISLRALVNYEKGVRTPSLEILIKIAKALGVSVKDLDPNITLWDEFDATRDVEKLQEELKVYEFLSQISTEDLIEELNRRDDFPIKIDLKH